MKKAKCLSDEIYQVFCSSVKWTPWGKFSSSNLVDHSNTNYSRLNKNTKNTFKTNQIFIITILLNLIQCVLEQSTRFGLENFAHGVRIQGFPERSISHYSNKI